MEISPVGVALVTGGTKGIGLAISKALAEDHWNLLLTYREDDENAKNSVSILHNIWPKIHIELVKGELIEKETVDKIFQTIKEKFDGKLTAYVQNAGRFVDNMPAISLEGIGSRDGENVYNYFQELYPKTFARIVERAQAIMPDGEGRIVTISVPGCDHHSRPLPFYYLPGPAKAATDYLVQYWAEKLVSRRITVNTVSVGFVKTTAWEPLKPIFNGDQGLNKFGQSSTPMKRWIETNEVGNAVSFLLKKLSGGITACTLNVDGGIAAFGNMSFSET